jgi:hypothetical protein
LVNYHQNPFDERIAKRVLFTQTPLSLSRSGEERSFSSLLCAPFLLKGGGFGTLTLYDKETDPSKFDERDLQSKLRDKFHEDRWALRNTDIIELNEEEIQKRDEMETRCPIFPLEKNNLLSSFSENQKMFRPS